MSNAASMVLRWWRAHNHMARRVATVVAAILFVYLLWPTPYQYESVAGKLVRINRLTGEARSVSIISSEPSSASSASGASRAHSKVSSGGSPTRASSGSSSRPRR